MPHHLDAASFLNTKTMCLITNYYKKLTIKFSNCIIYLYMQGSDRKADSSRSHPQE